MWHELEASDDGEAELTSVKGKRRELCRTANADVKGFAVILEASGVSLKGEFGKEQRWAKGKEDFKRVLLMSSGTCLPLFRGFSRPLP